MFASMATNIITTKRSSSNSDFFWRRRRRLCRKNSNSKSTAAFTICTFSLLFSQLLLCTLTSATLLPPEPALIPIVPASAAAALENDAGSLLYLQPAYDNEIVGGDSGVGLGLDVGGGYHGGGGGGGGSGGGSPHKYSFAVAPGVLSPEYDSVNGFDYRREYSPKLKQIYSRYLNKPTGDFSDGCMLSSGSGGLDNSWLGGAEPEGAEIDGEDFASAFLKAGAAIEQYERSNQEYLATDPRGLNFSAYVYVATLHAKYNELLTGQLKIK